MRVRLYMRIRYVRKTCTLHLARPVWGRGEVLTGFLEVIPEWKRPRGRPTHKRHVKGKGKRKVNPKTSHDGPEGENYRSTPSLTLALDGAGWSTPRPGRFNPGKETWYPLYGRLGGLQGRSERVRNISPLPGFDPRTVQPVASSYTDWAIPAPTKPGRIILKLIFIKWDVETWKGLIWYRIGTGGGLLWMRRWTFGLDKIPGISVTSWITVSFSRTRLLHAVCKPLNCKSMW